jgi:beta-glucosidase
MRKFPPNFLWGTATAAYQIEGAARLEGRGPSIWDAFSHIPGKIHDGHTGDVACDHYHRYEEDIALLKDMGVKCYRFSISWPRILPQGRGQVNEKGVAFYNKLIDLLLENDIEPWVTIYHWDLPLALQIEMDGLMNPAIATCFADFARICFARFGDRIRHWITLNEPWCCALLGHGSGDFAPGRESETEPYVVAHNLLRAHAYMVDIYRREFQATQRGVIGITNNSNWYRPLTDSEEDRAAAERALDFTLGWFAEPVYFGCYPQTMRDRIGSKLPEFTEEDRALLKGSSDFFGLNHYSTNLAAEPPSSGTMEKKARIGGGIMGEHGVDLTDDPSWKQTDMGWNIVPWGLRELLCWISTRYGQPPIYVTENGCAMPGEGDREVALNDTGRVEFFKGYLGACHEAIERGADLRGYMSWGMMDNFEWEYGESKRFGLIWVDFENQDRYPKASYHWYSNVCKSNGLED